MLTGNTFPSLRAGSLESRASGEEQIDPAGRSLVKRCQESKPALISVFFFISASPERSEIPLVEMRERRENCQSIMFDEERLDPHGVGNLPHVLTVKKSRPHLDSKEKHLQRSEQAHFLVSRLRRSISRSRLRRARLCSNLSLLAGYTFPNKVTAMG